MKDDTLTPQYNTSVSWVVSLFNLFYWGGAPEDQGTVRGAFSQKRLRTTALDGNTFFVFLSPENAVAAQTKVHLIKYFVVFTCKRRRVNRSLD